jgi:hypothetical protein
MKQCAHCGKDFEPTKPKAIYCSVKCRTYAFRDRKKNNLKFSITEGPTLIPAVKQEEKSSGNPEKIEIKITEPKPGSMAYYLKYGKNE